MFKTRVENYKKLELMQDEVIEFANLMIKALNNGNKILFCGNGGSASDANHLACEFISKFQMERTSLSAISLSSNNSILTAIANDYNFEDVFSRQIEGLGNKNDVLVAISTSGKSKNIIKAIQQAKKQGLKTIFLTGQNKSNIETDFEFNAPSDITCEIQEMHIVIGHILCELVEKALF